MEEERGSGRGVWHVAVEEECGMWQWKRSVAGEGLKLRQPPYINVSFMAGKK